MCYNVYVETQHPVLKLALGEANISAYSFKHGQVPCSHALRLDNQLPWGQGTWL